MASSPAFRLFGFPIHVRAGFLMFMVLVVFVNGGTLGVWIAGSAAVLTLLHELGHAFAARATGAEAEIALDFLAGYASFVPTRRLRAWERAGISLAGPAIQIGTSVAVLMAMGVNPLDRASIATSDAAIAIWWTGPVMGLFNLVPVLPLDGGHVVQAGLDVVIPKYAQKVMLWFSVVVTVGGALFCFTNARYQGLTFFVIFPLLVQMQMLFPRSQRAGGGAGRPPAAVAEDRAWATGDVSAMPPSVVPSPWFRASQQLAHGFPDIARDVLLADFTETSEPNWWPPDTAPVDRLASLAALLPRPLPTGRLYREHALAAVLLRVGHREEAAQYAAGIFRRTPTTTAASIVARAAGALGDADTAIGWPDIARDVGTDPHGLASTIDGSPELAALRADPRVTELRQSLAA